MSEEKRYKKDYRSDGWPILDAKESAIMGDDDICNRLNDYEQQRDQLLEALEKAREDINWMINSQKLLNGHVFDYIDAAIAAAKGQ